MKEFDIDKIGKGMPYKAPNKEFFDNFTDKLLAKVEQKPKRMSISFTMLAPFVAIAAAVVVILTISLDLGSNLATENGYYISENLDESLDSYFASLSDEQLAALVSNSTGCQDDFYDNLPNN
ncbi:MAG: hypothetical protein R3Y08_02525 [Rikenellaceae bacterium]